LDRLAVAEVVARGGDVIHPIGDEYDLRVVALLAELLDAAMEVANHHVRIDDPFPIEVQHYPQHAMRARVLRSHVENELRSLEHYSMLAGAPPPARAPRAFALGAAAGAAD